MPVVRVEFDRVTGRGRLACDDPETPAWRRVCQMAISSDSEYRLSESSIEIGWTPILGVIRELASHQRRLGFAFKPDDSARERIDWFLQDMRSARNSRDALALSLTPQDVDDHLLRSGFVKRRLKWYQLRDLAHLVSLRHGANFSVPGAGKTTVTLALNTIVRRDDWILMVVAPKSAFTAWQEAVVACFREDAPSGGATGFSVVRAGFSPSPQRLGEIGQRLLITYDQLIRMPDAMRSLLAVRSVHLVLDESHRMKAGDQSQRGQALLSLAPFAIRRDILTGTPMPQSVTDVQSQLEFLWPGVGVGREISDGIPPRQAIGKLYVRTTKRELDLPPVTREYIHVPMDAGQLALYTVIRDEALSQLSALRRNRNVDLLAARRSVVRLLQVSVNPVLALAAMTSNATSLESGIADAVIAERISPKVRKATELARSLKHAGRKALIWTIFTDTITQLSFLLADLNPVVLQGSTPSGSPEEDGTREAILQRFHEDDDCHVLIANPAAVAEGISLHQVCHDAIYVDRTYNATHYLQSIDRIHRLGLSAGTVTTIRVLQSALPAGIGSIDYSVSRRLASKARAMQQLLDDPDLHEIALDEESAGLPIDYDVRPEDLDDLIMELEGRLSLSDRDLI